MENKPFFSVIIPTYNRANLVGRAIQSVLNQTWSNFELLVVDDGSTDNTQKVVKAFSDKRIRYIQLTYNKGVNVARNTAIHDARADWIAFIDSDDEYLPMALDTMHTYIQKASELVRAIFFPIYNIDHEYVSGYQVNNLEAHPITISYYDMLLKNNITGDMTNCVSRSVFQEGYWFPEEVNGLESLLWTCVAKQWQILFVNEIIEIMHYDSPIGDQLHTQNQSLLNPKGLAKSLQEHYYEHQEALLRYPAHRSKLCIRIAYCYALLGNRKEALSWSWRGLRAYPGRMFSICKKMIPTTLAGKLIRAHLLRKNREVKR